MNLPDICWGGTQKYVACPKCGGKDFDKINLDSEGYGPCKITLTSVTCKKCGESWKAIT